MLSRITSSIENLLFTKTDDLVDNEEICEKPNEKYPTEFELRINSSDVPLALYKSISYGKYKNKWCGVDMMKDPLSMGVYNALVSDQKFGTIFELGTYKGASAHWFHTIAKQYNENVLTYSFDINDPSFAVDCKFLDVPNLHYVQMDAINTYKDIFSSTFLKDKPKPWLIIEDCHVNIINVLSYLDIYLTKGDYIVIEDTNPLGPYKPITSDDEPFFSFGMKKMNETKEFIKKVKFTSNYIVDTTYCDLYGYNCSWQWNSVLKKV